MCRKSIEIEAVFIMKKLSMNETLFFSHNIDHIYANLFYMGQSITEISF